MHMWFVSGMWHQTEGVLQTPILSHGWLDSGQCSFHDEL